MDLVMGTPWRTSQSLSPASQPKSSGNSSTKMVRVRPLVWRLCFFFREKQPKAWKQHVSTFLCLCLVCFPKFRFVVFFWFDLPVFVDLLQSCLEKDKQNLQMLINPTFEESLKKSASTHPKQAGGVKKSLEVEVVQTFVWSFYTLKPL